MYDLPTKLTGTAGTANGINYSEITGINSFSGGTGAVSLTPNPGLPVEYKTFTGWNDNEVNRLEWITATEINSDYSVIERMTDS